MACGCYAFTQSNARARRGDEVNKASRYPLLFPDSVISSRQTNLLEVELSFCDTSHLLLVSYRYFYHGTEDG